MKKVILVALAAGLLAGCASPKQSAQAPQNDPNQNVNANAGVDTAAVNAEALAKAEAEAKAKREAEAAALAAARTNANADPLNDPSSALAKRSVFFPLDVDSIQDQDKVTVQAHGEYLAAHGDRKVRIEGNADERGSTEYNLALGQRRADNTKRALVLSGANAGQIETMSFGEEKPRAAGHNEESWMQNRRGDIVYK